MTNTQQQLEKLVQQLIVLKTENSDPNTNPHYITAIQALTTIYLHDHPELAATTNKEEPTVLIKSLETDQNIDPNQYSLETFQYVYEPQPKVGLNEKETEDFVLITCRTCRKNKKRINKHPGHNCEPGTFVAHYTDSQQATHQGNKESYSVPISKILKAITTHHYQHQHENYWVGVHYQEPKLTNE